MGLTSEELTHYKRLYEMDEGIIVPNFDNPLETIDYGFHNAPDDNAYSTSWHYRFINDVEELFKFWLFAVPKINEDRVLFWSLSARNKQLSPEEREKYKLGRSEMFHKTVIRKNGWRYFISSLRSSEVNRYALLTNFANIRCRNNEVLAPNLYAIRMTFALQLCLLINFLIHHH